jgi:uncharacterized protein
MSGEGKFSDEFLNSFVDDQLGGDEKGRLYTHLNQDEDVKRQVCELRTLRELVQFAYKDTPMPAAGLIERRRINRRIGVGIAAAITLIVGAVMGWAINKPLTTDVVPPMAQAQPSQQNARAATVVSGTPDQTSTTRPTVNAAPVIAAADPVSKILVHYNSGDIEKAAQTLDDLEGMLKYYRTTGQIARVELVVNGDGLNLLRADASDYAERIERMQREYDNLSFVACQNTIDRLKRETGIVARLLPGVVVIDSGVAQLMRRQHQGWAYIQA